MKRSKPLKSVTLEEANSGDLFRPGDRIHPLKKGVDPPPECFGLHEHDHPDCVSGPCPYRAYCIGYQRDVISRANDIGADPEKLRAQDVSLHGMDWVIKRVNALVRVHAPKDVMGPQLIQIEMANLFRDILTEELRMRGIKLRNTRDYLKIGEIGMWESRSNRGGQITPHKWTVSVRAAGNKQVPIPICRFILSDTGHRPNIEYRFAGKPVLERWPALEDAGERWRGMIPWQISRWCKDKKSPSLGATCLRAKADRVSGLARLLVASIEEGIMPGVYFKNGKVYCTDRVYTWRKWK